MLFSFLLLFLLLRKQIQIQVLFKKKILLLVQILILLVEILYVLQLGSLVFLSESPVRREDVGQWRQGKKEGKGVRLGMLRCLRSIELGGRPGSLSLLAWYYQHHV